MSDNSCNHTPPFSHDPEANGQNGIPSGMTQEDLYRGLFAHLHEPAIIVDAASGIVIDANDRCARMLGWNAEELAGKQSTDLFADDCMIKILSSLENAGPDGMETHGHCLTSGNEPVPVTMYARSLGGTYHLIVMTDMTDHLRHEDEQLRACKLESIGLLAGGIAHDFNNILASILGNLAMAKMSIDSRDEVLKLIGDAEKAGLGARSLTNQLLTFAKGGDTTRETAGSRQLVEECASFSLRGTNVRWSIQSEDNVCNVDVDRGQMHQVFNNLLINAVQAMPSGGSIDITVRNTRLTGEGAFGLPEGDYVVFTVSDEGDGIPGEHLMRIFDPYFTTKQKGSGLGLASVYTIVKRHCGHVTVASVEGSGTTFYVYLPASKKEVGAGRTTVETVETSHPARILLMDDEEPVRTVLEKMLIRMGNTVETAVDDNEAIEKFRRAYHEKEPFDVALLDLTIPGGMGGREVFEYLRDIDPDIRGILLSGYARNPIMASFREYGFSSTIVKPFQVDDIRRALAEALPGE